MSHDIDTVVQSAAGALNAIVSTGSADSTLPGVVMVDGSGDGGRHDWGGWPGWVHDAGAVVLRHDKPGCGGSPGNWREQSLQDRARESVAAVGLLRAHLDAGSGSADGSRPSRQVGLYGVSQGGWVALIAAAMAPQMVDFVICHSGPGVGPFKQERDRIEAQLVQDGLSADEVMAGMDWVDRRSQLLRGNTDVAKVLAEQRSHLDQRWFAAVSYPYDDPADLQFFSRILDFEPVDAIAQVVCPVLALFGGADTVVDARTNVTAMVSHLPPSPDHGLAVFPGADHGLYIADRDPLVPRVDQLAPAYLPTLRAFLANRRSPARPR
jgi:pimeloyl-ACP methyl ester carboxylesterase